MFCDPSSCSCGTCGKQTDCALLDAASEFPHEVGLQVCQEVFCANTPIAVNGDCLLVVKSGAVKSVCRYAQSQCRVVAFSFPGDLFGLEAVSGAEHAELLHEASVSMTAVCRIRLSPDAAKRASSHFCERLSAELAARIRDNFRHRQIVVAAAQVRMAHWLMQCMRALPGENATQSVRLPDIARVDIASYLHLRPETISRVLSDFRKNDWVRGPLHRLEVRDAEALTRLACGMRADPHPAQNRQVMHG